MNWMPENITHWGYG